MKIMLVFWWLWLVLAVSGFVLGSVVTVIWKETILILTTLLVSVPGWVIHPASFVFSLIGPAT